MILIMDINAAYLIIPASLSRIAGQYYFTKRVIDYSEVNPTPNGPILT